MSICIHNIVMVYIMCALMCIMCVHVFLVIYRIYIDYMFTRVCDTSHI